MKNRFGFVSNSSTSSFLILGFEAPKKSLWWERRKELTDKKLLWVGGGDCLIAKAIMNYDYEKKSLSEFMKDCSEAEQIIKAIAKELGVGEDKISAHLIAYPDSGEGLYKADSDYDDWEDEILEDDDNIDEEDE